jgi:hypothetical protein
MYLFANNDKGTPVICDGQIKLYNLKVYQKNSAADEYVLLRDYKPAVKNDRVCLYDDVGKTIIYPKNANGEDGVIGPSFIKVFATEQNSKSPIEQLVEAVRTAPDNSIITIERGTYRFPDDVYMADNTLSPTSESYCKIRLNVTQNGLIIRGEDSSSRRTWEFGREPVIIDGNGGKAIQFQLEATGSARVENIAFVNCDGGAYGSNNESLYGNWCNGGAIGIGKLVVNKWNGGENVVISNCVFRDNRSAMGGAIGGKNNYFVQDSLFTNNVPDRYSGCMYFGSAYGCDFIKNVTPVQQVDVVDNCTFVSNTTSSAIVQANVVSNSVLIGNSASGWDFIAKATTFANCHFTNNYLDVYGVVSANGGVVTNCTFHGNETGNQQYGTLSEASLVVDCRFTSNGGYGGGAFSIASSTVNSLPYRSLVKNCYFNGNHDSVGGGAAVLKSDLNGFSVESLQEPLITFENCVFEENYTNPGAGGHGGAILNLAKNIPEGVALESLIMCTNCSFVGNSAMHGSGVEGVTAIDCFFNNDGELGFNYRGIDAALSRLVDCEIRGGNLYKCSIDRSWVNGVAKHGVFSLGCYVTNTLVSGCTIQNENVGLIGSYHADQNLSETPSEFVNCTFVGNKANLFMNACYVTSINCAYFDNTNRTGEATSVSFSSSDVNGGNIVFENCAFGSISSSVGTLYGSDNKTDLEPRFAAGKNNYIDEPYYSPMLSSPLRGWGRVLNYGEADVDLSGRPRVRDGKVDIGCYQCWTMFNSWMMIIR